MTSVTAVFDVGRTNKKFFLFDKDFREVYREYVTLPEIEDEDGFPTEDVAALGKWLREVFHRILEAEKFRVKAINFSSYGASFVHLDVNGEILTPLYNYSKPLDPALEDEFYAKYGPEAAFTAATGSPRSGLLNSGMQLYWLKKTQPKVFKKIRYSLHLPQYLSYVFTGVPLSEYTSIGCHTSLWDYAKKDYHDWVYAEKIHHKFPPIVSTETSINMNYNGRRIKIGVGIHDSSAALLPYVRSEKKKFLLVSTGTWSVALNPRARGALNPEEDGINYMRIDGKPVRASRLHLGYRYQQSIRELAARFGVKEDHHKSVVFNHGFYGEIVRGRANPRNTYAYAYHEMMIDLVREQSASIRSALGGQKVERIFIDGGFSDNDIYVKLLSHFFRKQSLRTTDSSLGSALGAAICISDTKLNSKFLKRNYGLKKHRPFIVAD